MPRRTREYHEELFHWHCENFFPFDQRLSRAELRYLSACFALATDTDEVSKTGYEHFSYYTYSHRVRGTDVRSGRIAYGSLSSPDRAREAAEPVIQERGVALPTPFDGQEHDFYGLGWDLDVGHFKIYLHVADVTGLPSHLLELAGPDGEPDLRAEGLVSFTYAGKEIFEEKVYVYRKTTAQLGVKNEALMRTSRRGTVQQLDVADPELWITRINPTGQAIVEKYRSIGQPLDTIAWQDQDTFTLYFP